MIMDLDSTVCEVHGDHKQGAYGYTHKARLPPAAGHQGRHRRGAARPPAHRAGQHRPRRGRFVDELAARVRRAGATGELTMRMDSGFWSATTIRACRRHRLRYSITVRQTKPIRAMIATIPEDAWADIAYPDGGLALG